ncbi:MAG: Na(+)-translocating NADH-quinone reductase subunit A [Hahellaceae bacterium]|nr:Na(+)-translocating NADH-quinone reductase subunit A [Hahellaceae bacterium]
MIKIKKGLSLPITGAPTQSIEAGKPVSRVAIIGFDYPGMKPTMEVKEGDQVKCGQLLFTDKKNPGVRYTAPASGVVSAIHRGEKRVFQSLVIDVKGDEHETFAHFNPTELNQLTREQVRDTLVQSGEWVAFKTRPYGKSPAVDAEPHSIFITAMDTHPLAANPKVILEAEKAAFRSGIQVIAHLTRGKVFVCTAPDLTPELPAGEIKHEVFDGPHPAGLAGTHIHFLDPVSAEKSVWSIGYQDVIAIGHLFTTGKKYTKRVVALAGPSVKKPRLVSTRAGACLSELTAGELNGTNNRVISGSVFGGRHARGSADFLGRFANQVSCLEEGNVREFMGWLSPGSDRFSVLGIYLSKLTPGKLFNFNTSTNGSDRAMVPVGSYEKVMPLDILPTQLLRSLIVGDTEMAQKLGCLELDEEDLSLCTFVCPGKYEYGPILRDNLTRIEKEG